MTTRTSIQSNSGWVCDLAVQSLRFASYYRRASLIHRTHATKTSALLAFAALLMLVAPARADECETYRLALGTARNAQVTATVSLETAVESHIDATLEASLDPKPRSLTERQTEIEAARDARRALHVAFTALKSVLDAAGNDRAALKSARAAAYEVAHAISRAKILEATYDTAIETALVASTNRTRDALVDLVGIEDDRARERDTQAFVAADLSAFNADVEAAYNSFYADFANVGTATLTAIEAALVAIEASASCH